jgi:hypothetical protein
MESSHVPGGWRISGQELSLSVAAQIVRKGSFASVIFRCKGALTRSLCARRLPSRSARSCAPAACWSDRSRVAIPHSPFVEKTYAPCLASISTARSCLKKRGVRRLERLLRTTLCVSFFATGRQLMNATVLAMRRNIFAMVIAVASCWRSRLQAPPLTFS